VISTGFQCVGSGELLGEQGGVSDENGLCFVNIDLKLPFSKITKQFGRCMGEPVDYGVSSPRLGKNGGVIGI
jgi:hypothetical protein